MEGRPPEDDPLREPGSGHPDDGGLRGSIADGVKKALLAGVGALFLTEEGARRIARDWKLPKDLADYVGRQATTAKEELLKLFAAELRRFLESEPVRKEFWKALSENAIEIQAEIRLRPVDGGAPKPEVTASVRPKGRARKGSR